MRTFGVFMSLTQWHFILSVTYNSYFNILLNLNIFTIKSILFNCYFKAKELIKSKKIFSIIIWLLRKLFCHIKEEVLKNDLFWVSSTVSATTWNTELCRYFCIFVSSLDLSYQLQIDTLERLLDNSTWVSYRQLKMSHLNGHIDFSPACTSL